MRRFTVAAAVVLPASPAPVKRHFAIVIFFDTQARLERVEAKDCLTARRSWAPTMDLPLERLEIESMASGNDAFALTERVGWDAFPRVVPRGQE